MGEVTLAICLSGCTTSPQGQVLYVILIAGHVHMSLCVCECVFDQDSRLPKERPPVHREATKNSQIATGIKKVVSDFSTSSNHFLLMCLQADGRSFIF
jgi:hypothetical protein